MEFRRKKSPRRMWTLDERKRIAILIKRGAKTGKIAIYFNATVDQIYSEYLRGGGKDDYDPIRAHETYLQTPSTDLRSFTEKELETIRKMLEEGYNLFNIRKEISCGYEPLKRVIIEKFPNLWNQRDRSVKTIIERIEAIEEQIKLIYELMEEK